MPLHRHQAALTDNADAASGSLAECKGQRSVDEVAQVGQQLAVVAGHQVTPLEVCVRLLGPVAEQVVAPDLQSAQAASQRDLPPVEVLLLVAKLWCLSQRQPLQMPAVGSLDFQPKRPASMTADTGNISKELTVQSGAAGPEGCRLCRAQSSSLLLSTAPLTVALMET